MKVLVSVLLGSFLAGCAMYSHETMVWTYVAEGGLDYYHKGKKSEATYLYDVHILEKSTSAGDLHNYQTNTTELRAKTAQILLSSKYHTGCQNVEFVDESSYSESGNRKRWLNGMWWKVTVICQKPTNPKKNKFS